MGKFNLERRHSFSIVLLRKILPGFLILSQVATPELLHAAQSSAAEDREIFRPSSASLAAREDLEQSEPFIEVLSRPEYGEFLSSLPDFTAEDREALADADPYFLRSQSWVNPSFEGSSLVLREGSGALKLNAPLEKVYENSEYLVLSSKSSDGVFARKEGQGVFLVDREEFKVSSQKKLPVPVYFFPLPGMAWDEGVVAFEEPADDHVLYLGDADGEVLPVSTRDFDSAVKAQRLNLMLAVSEKILRGDVPADFGRTLETSSVLPDPGSTFAFGLYYDAARALPLLTRVDPAKRELLAKSSFFERLEALVLGPSAYAQTQPPPVAGSVAHALVAADNSKLVGRLIRVGAIVSLTFASAVVLKYTVLRKHFQLKHEKDPQKVSTLKREMTDIGDVFAHNLNVFSSFASVWFANSVEFFVDRFFPKLGAAENGMVRRLLNKTLLYRRNVNDRIPVSGQTWFYGSIIFGGIDSFCVYLQNYYVIPGMAHYIATHVPSTKEAINEAWDPSNPETESINRNEFFRNVTSYMTAGAASFGKDLQDQNLMVIQKEARDEFLRSGRNPDDPAYQPAYRARVDALMNARNKDMGLPDKSDFLFDAASLYQKASAFLGYAPIANPDAKGPQSYWAEKRTGLTISILEVAIERGEELLRQYPQNTELQKAVELLRLSHTKAQPLKHFVTRPLSDFFKSPEKINDLRGDYKELRRELVTLTIEGPAFQQLKRLPLSWVQRGGTEAADLAANLYRASFVSAMKGVEHKTNRLNDFTDAEKQKMVDRVMVEMGFKYPEEVKANLAAGHTEEEALRAVAHRHPAEATLRLTDLADQVYAKRLQAAKPYKPQRLDSTGKGQLARAKSDTNLAYEQQRGRSFDGATATPDEELAYRRTYAEKFAKNMGLRMDFSSEAMAAKKDSIFSSAEDGFNRRLQDPAVTRFLQGLKNPQDAADLRARLFTEELIPVYLSAVADSAAVSQTDPAQPGMFQSLRQKPAFRKSKILSRLARAMECLWPNTEYKPGLWSLLKRRVPFLADTMYAFTRVGRNITDRLTATYASNWLVWGMNPTVKQVLWGQILAPTILVPGQIMNRLFASQGWQPMGRKGMMVFYSLIYTWVTFLGQFPYVLGQKTFNELYTQWGMKLLVGALAIWGWNRAAEGFAKLSQKMKVNADLAREKEAEAARRAPPPAPPAVPAPPHVVPGPVPTPPHVAPPPVPAPGEHVTPAPPPSQGELPLPQPAPPVRSEPHVGVPPAPPANPAVPAPPPAVPAPGTPQVGAPGVRPPPVPPAPPPPARVGTSSCEDPLKKAA